MPDEPSSSRPSAATTTKDQSNQNAAETLVSQRQDNLNSLSSFILPYHLHYVPTPSLRQPFVPHSPHPFHTITNTPNPGQVLILTSDGRTLTGTLLGHDQTTNLILSGTIERIFAPLDSDEITSEVDHGLYLIRGDNVVVCGLVDEELERGIEWEKVKAEGLGGIKHI